jgi:hypothetical protein
MALEITHSYISSNGDPADSTIIGQTKWNAQHSVSGTLGPDEGVRELLTSNRTYYVSTSGSDSNNGLTSGTAWATIQFAWDTICRTVDCAGFIAYIQLADGDYSESPFLINQPVGGAVFIQGNTSDQTKVTLSGAWTMYNVGTGCQLQYVKSTVGQFYVYGVGCDWYFFRVDFNSVFTHYLADGGASISVFDKNSNGALENHYTITGNFNTHISVAPVSIGYLYNCFITFVGSPVMSAGFLYSYGGTVNYYSVNPTGTVTGPQYNISSEGLVQDFSSPSDIPGTLPGIQNSGALYNNIIDLTIHAAPLLNIVPTANQSALSTSAYSLTGSDAHSMVDLAGTWNTSGTPTALKLNITDTASNAASLLMDLQVGGSSKLRVDKTGTRTPALRIDAAPSAVGTGAKTISNAADSSTNFGHYFAINLNGTVYYVACSSVAPT